MARRAAPAASPGGAARLPGRARQRRQLLRPLRGDRWRRRRGRGGVRGHPRHRRGRRTGGAGRGRGGRQRHRRRVGSQPVAHTGGRRRALRLRALRPRLRRDLAQRGGARARLRRARRGRGHGRNHRCTGGRGGRAGSGSRGRLCRAPGPSARRRHQPARPRRDRAGRWSFGDRSTLSPGARRLGRARERDKARHPARPRAIRAGERPARRRPAHASRDISAAGES